MSNHPSPSIEVAELHEISGAEARALVDQRLGPPSTWPPKLVQWRLAHGSQEDWKAEVGQYLRIAEKHGFLERLLTRLKRARRVHKKFANQIHPNEKSHLDLMAELAPAMVTHYLVGTGWRFSAWEPDKSLRDVDVELITPSGSCAALQVKAPGEPASDTDDRILAAIEHARVQLQGAEQPSMIVVCAQRAQPAAAHPGFVAGPLVGWTTQIGSLVVQPKSDLGRFINPEWRHIGAVVLLDHLRGLDRFLYTCTVLLNPWADPMVRCEREWFPRARVCWGDEQHICWQAGPPTGPVYARSKIVTRWW